MSYPRYTECKDSGVEWLGEIPAHWELMKLHHTASLKSGTNITTLMMDSSGEFPVYGGNGVRGYFDSYTHDGCYVLIGRQGALCGNVNYAIGRFWASEHAVVVDPLRNFDTFWMGELLRSMDLNQYSIAAAQPGLSVEQIGRLKIPFPPLPEQQAIARFLDYKTAQIDALIAKKEALLAKLAEKRTALISQAVTKGLDPDAPMKESGVEWLGEIPAGWNPLRLRFVLSVNPSKNEVLLSGDELVSFVPMESVGEYGGLNLDDEKLLDEIGSGYTYFADGDVVVAKITPCFENGKGALAENLSNGTAFGTTELHVLRANNELDRRFLFYLTISYPFRKIGEAYMYGAAGQKRVPENFIKDLRVGIPPLEEQKRIVSFLEHKTAEMDDLFAKIQQAIDKLQEHRTSLITHTVTGKIDVRDFAPPEPSS